MGKLPTYLLWSDVEHVRIPTPLNILTWAGCVQLQQSTPCCHCLHSTSFNQSCLDGSTI